MPLNSTSVNPALRQENNKPTTIIHLSVWWRLGVPDSTFSTFVDLIQKKPRVISQHIIKREQLSEKERYTIHIPNQRSKNFQNFLDLPVDVNGQKLLISDLYLTLTTYVKGIEI